MILSLNFGEHVRNSMGWRKMGFDFSDAHLPKLPLFLCKIYPVLSDLGWSFPSCTASLPIRPAERLIN